MPTKTLLGSMECWFTNGSTVVLYTPAGIRTRKMGKLSIARRGITNGFAVPGMPATCLHTQRSKQ